MEALGLDTSLSKVTCNSVQDLQDQLHQLLATKSTDIRAEHTSTNFELRSQTPFHLADDADNLATGSTDLTQPQQQQQQAVTRIVLASETVQNQPTDNPVLQKAVAKHISSAVGAVDNSAWIVRQVARGAQGWKFTYICKDSLQAWNRANAKNAERPVIGSYSGSGGLDPINLSRPAFDCRGTLTVAFSKSSRGVIVKYEHTPLHKTVQHLVERLAPVPVPVPSSNNGSQRTPKAKRPPPTDGEEESRKKKRTPKAKRPPPAEDENGEESRKKRRKKSKASEANTERELKESHNTPQSQAQPHAAMDKASSTAFLNVPPAEAERRRQTAVELLTGKGIDPGTLSTEQFNIFANQAPNLQSASLDMLAKYGAERLRIVHPVEKEQAGSSNSSAAGDMSANASPAAAPALTSGSTSTPTKKPRNKKKKSDGPVTEVSIGNGAVVSLEQDGELGTTESALRPKNRNALKTRGICDTCRQRKTKCTKEHPSCSTCIAAGVSCIYLPPKPRRKSQKSAVVVEEEVSDLPEEVEQVEHVEQVERVGQVEHEVETHSQVPKATQPLSQTAALPQPPPDLDNEEFIPDPNILSGPVEHHKDSTQAVNTNNYYERSHGAINFPPMSSNQASAGNTSMPNLTFPQTQAHEDHQPISGLAFPSTSIQPQQTQELSFSQSVSASKPKQRRQSASASSRKSLPTSQSKQTPVPLPTIPAHTSNWNPSPPASGSPKAAQQQAAKRPRPRKPKAESGQQGQDGMKSAAPQSTQHQSPMTRSPYQSSAHVNIRQGHRSQTNTPVAVNSRPPPQAPASATDQPTTSAASYNTPTPSSSVTNYDPYPRYNNNVNEQYTDTSNEHSSSRITYEPGSYQAHTTTTTPTSYSTPSYDYGRTSNTSNPLSQALNNSTGYSGLSNSATNQWPTSQARGGQSSSSSSTYPLPSSSTSNSHGYGTRPSDSRASNQNASYSQSQSQNYSSYSSQQPSLNQQSQQNWYGFTAANSNNPASYPNNRQSNYGNQRSNVPAYSSQYNGTDEQSIYDLLRAGNSNN
ncbi:hypothetical protein F5Y19DRAFT_345351 [Xylariaceae sp. FL1651]|nr:hypothetical protein F5Y19DRAFT_345351 [Xylariaceae sp. FL1651]